MGALMIGTVDIMGQHAAISSRFVALQLTSADPHTPTSEVSLSGSGEPVIFCFRTNYTGAWTDFLTNIPGLEVDVDTTGDTANWVNVTMHDADHMRDILDPEYNPSDIRKVILVRYNIGATLG
jgi:hypothetical protein